MGAFDVTVCDDSGTPKTAPFISYGTATTASDGTWSLDISNVGYTNIFSVATQVISADQTVANAGYTSVSTFSTTTVSGRAVKPVTLGALGGLTAQSIGSGHTVYVTVIGN